MSTGGYPVSYRAGSRAGFQSRAGFSRPILVVKPKGVFLTPQIPAIPDAGPDWRTQRILSEAQRAVQLAALRGSARLASRLVPGLNVAEPIIEAMVYWYRWNVDHQTTHYVNRDMGNFTQCPGSPCPGRVATHMRQGNTTSCAAACAIGQAIASVTEMQPILSTSRFVWYLRPAASGVPNRWDIVEGWSRPAAGPAPLGITWIDPAYFQPPSYAPALWPDILPISRPAGLPLPVPSRLAAWKSNNPLGMAQGRQVGPVPAVRPPPAPPTTVIIDIKPQVNAAVNVSARSTRVPHMKKPPKKGEREHKNDSPFKPSAAQAFTLNALTEPSDFLDALWNALPYDYRKGRSNNEFYYNKALRRWEQPSQLMKFDDLIDHPEKIDWQKALKNVAIQQLGDFGIGKLSQRASRSWYSSPYGALRAPRSSPYNSMN